VVYFFKSLIVVYFFKSPCICANIFIYIQSNFCLTASVWIINIIGNKRSYSAKSQYRKLAIVQVNCMRCRRRIAVSSRSSSCNERKQIFYILEHIHRVRNPNHRWKKRNRMNARISVCYQVLTVILKV